MTVTMTTDQLLLMMMTMNMYVIVYAAGVTITLTATPSPTVIGTYSGDRVCFLTCLVDGLRENLLPVIPPSQRRFHIQLFAIPAPREYTVFHKRTPFCFFHNSLK